MPADLLEAGGALCWRRAADSGLELLLVHSARWGDWSWPKGKRERHEPLPRTAVREVREETGAVIRLGPPLPAVDYTLPDGQPKRVSYWAATPLDLGTATAGQDEIDDTAWLPVAVAAQHLTRPGDRPPLERLLELDRAGLLDVPALIVVRHAKAVSRAAWSGSEATRPLHPAGIRQARRLAELLDCWRPARLISSPWIRCEQTLTAYGHEHDLAIELDPALTEAAYREDPEQARNLALRLLAGAGQIAVCTHRPVLAGLVGILAARGTPDAAACLPDADPWLTPAQILVAHHRDGRVLWVEKH